MNKIRIKDLESSIINSIVATDSFGRPFYSPSITDSDGLWLTSDNQIEFKTLNSFIRNGISYDETNHWVQLGGALNENTIIDGVMSYNFNIRNVINMDLAAAHINLSGTLKVQALSGTGNRMVVADLNGVLSTLAIPSGGGGGGGGGDWGSISGTISAQTDLQDELDLKASIIYVNNEIAVKTSYIHEQNIASGEWHVVHNLGYHPNVRVKNSAGDFILTDIQDVDQNNLKIIFDNPNVGIAFLS